MYARTKLAVMDHNSGIHRNQSRTKQGHLRFKTVYSRITSSWVAKKIMDKKDKNFIQEILQAIWSVGFDRDKQIICELEDIPRNIAKVLNPGYSWSLSHTLCGF